MYATFSWAYEARGSSGFIDYAANPTKATIVEDVNSLPPNATPRTPSTVYMTPKMSPSDEFERKSKKPSSTQPRDYHDVGVTANVQSSSRPKIRGDLGASRLSPFQVDRTNKRRPTSIENGISRAKFGRREGTSDKDDGKDSRLALFYNLTCH